MTGDELSYSGQCVKTGGFDSPFASGCAVPCNPTWEAARVAEICGTVAVCCAFTELDPAKDCVIDPDTGMWRAVRGTDIRPLSKWGAQHTTNQDPTGASCTLFASGGVPGETPDKVVLDDCYDQLSVADQRGFCYAPSACVPRGPVRHEEPGLDTALLSSRSTAPDRVARPRPIMCGREPPMP